MKFSFKTLILLNVVIISSSLIYNGLKESPREGIYIHKIKDKDSYLYCQYFNGDGYRIIYSSEFVDDQEQLNVFFSKPDIYRYKDVFDYIVHFDGQTISIITTYNLKPITFHYFMEPNGNEPHRKLNFIEKSQRAWIKLLQLNIPAQLGRI